MRQHRIRFTCLLPSAHAGAYFRANITASWASVGFETSSTHEAIVRFRLYSDAKQSTESFAVSERLAAQDKTAASIDSFDVENGEGKPITQGTASIKLKVDRRSRRIETEFQRGCRDQQLQLEQERSDLDSLRRNIFRDEALARLWWLRQDPARLAAVDANFFDKTLISARESLIAEQHQAENYIHIIAEFVNWLHSGDSRTELALAQLDHLLASNNQTELLERFRRIRANPSNNRSGDVQPGQREETRQRDLRTTWFHRAVEYVYFSCVLTPWEARRHRYTDFRPLCKSS